MKVRWNFNQPRTFGLRSGASIYCLQRGQEIYISGYDWFNSESLKPYKKFFGVIDDSDDQTDDPKIVTREEIQSDKPQLKTENQPEKIGLDRMGKIATGKMTKEDKIKKVVKKHIKTKRKDAIIS